MIYIATTTINKPTKALKLFAKNKNCKLIVALDKKSKDFKLTNAVVLSTKYQEKKAELDQMLNQINFEIDVKESLTFDDKTSFVKAYRRDTKSEGSVMGKSFKSTGWVQIEFE